MDRKSLALLALAIVVMLTVSKVVDHYFPPKPVPPEQLARMSNSVAASAAALTNAPGTVAVAAVPSGGPEQTISLTNDDMIFNFTSRGGGLKSVSLRHYPAIITRGATLSTDSNLVTLNSGAPMPVMALLGLSGDSGYHLSRAGGVVTAEGTTSNGLRVTKIFEPGSNYLFTVRVRLQNPGGAAVAVPAREWVAGTASPVGPLDDPTTLGTFWYDGVKAQDIKQPWFDNRWLSCSCTMLPASPRYDYEAGAGNVVWGAVHNQFFTLAAMPSNSAPALHIRPVRLPVPVADSVSNSTTPLLTNGYQLSFAWPATNLAPGAALDNTVVFYAGPKEYNRLGRIGLAMTNHLDMVMDFSGPVGFFSKTLLLSMNGLHGLGLPYGLAIIAITVIIKLIFWPLTRAATRSQKRLQALQPQIKAIADKYADDPVKKNQKTMDFMKEHKVSPLGSCIPTLIQIPVFFGFYWMLRNSIELRGVPFLWAHDLSQPDTIGHISGFPINILPLIMGATQLWQAQLLPASQGVDPAQQKMMKFMPLMFIALLYRMSAGLTLYWTVQNLLSIVQTKLTRTDDPAPAGPATGPLARKKA